MPRPEATPLIWIDLEMTGLFPESCFILEIASVVTDSDLNVLGEGPDLVIHHGEAILEGMNEWCQVQHRESGLVDQVRASELSQDEAERQTIEFLSGFTGPGQSPLCGNSIQLDYRFLRGHMERLAAFTSGELVDVTTIKELSRRWYPATPPPPKSDAHRARDDIIESIAELKFYREQFFRQEAG